MCPISRPQTACLCDSPFDRSRRRDINRRPTEYRLTDRKRKRAKKPTAHGHNRVAVSSKWRKGKRHRIQWSMRRDFVRFFIPVSRFTFAGKSVCSYGRADPRGTGEGRTAGIHEGIFSAPRSAGAKEAGQHRLLGAAICQNDRGGKAGR